MQSPLSVRFFVKSGPNYVMGLEHDVGDINKGTDDQCSIRDQCRDPMSAPKPKRGQWMFAIYYLPYVQMK